MFLKKEEKIFQTWKTQYTGFKIFKKAKLK